MEHGGTPCICLIGEKEALCLACDRKPENLLMSTSKGMMVLTLWRGLLSLHLFVLKGFLRTSYRRSGAYQFHASSVYSGSSRDWKPISKQQVNS